MNYYTPPIRAITILLAAILLVAAILPALADSPYITAPSVFDPDDMLQGLLRKHSDARVVVEAAGSALAMNNIESIWDITNDRKPASNFTQSSGYAILQTGGRTRIGIGRFSIYAGKETRSAYAGNNDAAQLWIDYNAGSYTRDVYYPAAASTLMSSSWLGVGYSCPMRLGKVRINTDTVLRSLSAGKFTSRNLEGSMQDAGVDFYAMMSTAKACSTGRGWSADSRVQVLINDRLSFEAIAEGLFSSLTWDSVYAEQCAIQSPTVFADPDGYLHEAGGISGMTWNQKLTVRPQPHYRLDMAYTGRVDLLLGFDRPVDLPSTMYYGMAFPSRSKDLTPFFRYYPNLNCTELGLLGKGWQLRLSGDEWLLASPKRAAISLSAQPLKF